MLGFAPLKAAYGLGCEALTAQQELGGENVSVPKNSQTVPDVLKQFDPQPKDNGKK